jgi:hypothetical protein
VEQGRITGRPALNETGSAPRVLVTDWDRIETFGDGIYTFVGTSPLNVEGHQERVVVVYITVTWRAVARGVLLSAAHVVELRGMREMLAGLKTAYARLTMH